MAKETIYTQEKAVISKAENIIRDDQYKNSDLIEEYADLAKNYKKLFKTFNRIVNINDKQQHQLFEFQREILEYNEELKQLNATKDKFFSIISHDLKSPINSFLNVAALLIDHIDRFSKEEIQEMAASVRTSGSNLLKLLENLLHWSRLQMKHVEFAPQDYSIFSLAEGVLSVVNNQAREKEIELVSKLDRETVIYGDPNMLSSVLQNLVSNAVKFTYQGGTVTVDQKQYDDFVEISVIDTGVGIEPRNLEKLFRIDVIYTGIGTNSEKGTGLGLILCKEMVEKHKGKIWVESEPEKGSAFSFTIPTSETAYNEA